MKTVINLFIDGVDYSKPSEDRPCYLELEHTGGIKIYVSREFKRQYDNIIADEEEYHNYLTKCAIPGKNGRLIMCRHKCEECPFATFDNDQPGKRQEASLDKLTDEEGFDAASDEDVIADFVLKERKEKMWSEIYKLSKEEQVILSMWSEGMSERDIAEKLNKSKTAIHHQIEKIIQLLQAKCRGF